MLGFDVLCGTSYPILTFEGGIAVFHLIKFFLLLGWVDMEVSLFVHGLANCDVNIVLRWFLCNAREQVVNIPSRATVNLILFGNVTSVAGQIVLLVFDESLGTHF